MQGVGEVAVEGVSRVCRDQTTKNADASSVARQGREGTPLTNPAHVSVLTFQAGENMRNVLWNVALLTLGGIV